MDRREFMGGAGGLGVMMAIGPKTVVAADLPADATDMSASVLSAADIQSAFSVSTY